MIWPQERIAMCMITIYRLVYSHGDSLLQSPNIYTSFQSDWQKRERNAKSHLNKIPNHASIAAAIRYWQSLYLVAGHCKSSITFNQHSFISNAHLPLQKKHWRNGHKKTPSNIHKTRHWLQDINIYCEDTCNYHWYSLQLLKEYSVTKNHHSRSNWECTLRHTIYFSKEVLLSLKYVNA